MPRDKRIFVNPQGGAWKGGMDKDSSARYVQNGHYTYARNISYMVYGDKFTVTNLKGNTEKSYVLKTGTNICIGNFDDKANEAVYYFLFNGSGNHQVLRYQYNLTKDTITQIAYGVGLQFENTNLITGIDIVQDRYLVWTDDLNEISCIDIDNYQDLPTPLTVSDRWMVELLKTPNPNPVEVQFCSVTSKANNALLNKLYKFRTRYIYKGGFRTHASIISKLAKPDWSHEETPQNFKDNAISVVIEKPEHDQVEKVEVFVQSGNTDDTMGDWYKFSEVLYSDIDADYSDKLIVSYTGEQALEAVDQTEINQPYSFIPRRSKEVIFLPSNVLAFCNNTEGFDADIVPHVQAYPLYFQQGSGSATTTAVANNTGASQSGTFINPNFDIKLNTSLNYKTITIGGTPHAGDSINISLNLTLSGSVPISPSAFNYTVAYLVKDDETTTTIATNIARAINSGDTRDNGYGGVVAYSTSNVVRIVYGVNQNQAPYTPTMALVISILGISATNYISLGSRFNFKRFASHPLAIQYTDGKGRRSGAIPCASVYVEGQDKTSSTKDYRTKLRMIVSHDPPEDAVTWQPLYAKNTTYEEYLQKWVNMYLISEITFSGGSGNLPSQGANISSSSGGECFFINQVSGDSKEGVLRIAVLGGTFLSGNTLDYNTSTWTGTLDDDAVSTDLLAFDIYDRLQYDRETYGVQSDDYNFVDGDRVRLIAADSSGRTYFSDMPDLAIHSSDNKYVYAEYDVSSLTPSVTAPTTVIAEFWRPRDQNKAVFYYEIGQTYGISNGYHEGASQNQTASQGAIVTLENTGDSYYIFSPNEISVSDTDKVVESESIAYDYESAVTGIGRSNIESDSANKQITRGTAIAYTQPIIANSPTNGLSMALGTSINEYDNKFGGIQKASLRNNKQLVVYFEDKVGYLGILEELQKQASGDILYQTTALLNGIGYYSYDGGIGNVPESFSYNDTTQYFVSPRNNAVCRLANDGITEISSYGMSSWFNQNLDVKSNFIQGLQCFGTFDERGKNYIVSIRQTLVPDSLSNPISGFFQSLDLTIPNIGDGTLVSNSALLYDDSVEGWVKVDIEGITVSSSSVVSMSWNGGATASDVSNVILYIDKGTLAFNEPSNSWVSFLDFQPEMMSTCGVDYASFKEGALWVHNTNETRGSFYGEEFDAEITVPFNTPPDVQKKYENVEQEANSAWKSDTDGDIVTISGQTSLLEGAFYEEYQQGEWSSALRQDTSTPNETYPLLHGYDLRDRIITIRLVNSNTTKATLEAVSIGFSVSESSN